MKEATPKKDVTIGVMIGDVSYDYTIELMRGINDMAKQNSVQLLYMTGMQRHIAPDDSDNEQETASRYNCIYDCVPLVGADAYIISSGSLSGMNSDGEYRRFLKRFEGSPYVLLQKPLTNGSEERCSITTDNYTVFCKCIEHLIVEHQYQRIAYVSGPKQHPEAMEREQAYRDTMERHDLPVDETMVLYGDLSGFVDQQVGILLDNHPHLEAIAFCNDEMAKSGYRICEARGLRVGRDIAITGFDDFATGQTMIPPLTTVSQDAYRAGQLALIQALKLASGEPAESLKLKSNLSIRNSCGCYHESTIYMNMEDTKDTKRYIEAVAAILQNELLSVFTRLEQKQYAAAIGKLTDHIKLLALASFQQPVDHWALETWLVVFCNETGSASGMIAERLQKALIQITGAYFVPELNALYRIVADIVAFLYSYANREKAKQIEELRTQSWFVPEFIRDLVVIVDEDEKVFLNIIQKLKSIGLKNLYICLLPEPRIRRESHEICHTEKLLLAAYLNNDNAVAYPRSRMPVIDRDHPLCDLQEMDKAAHMISFSIFSGDMQFGICLCETDKENNPLMHIIGLQLGILMNFLDLKRRERVVAKEIEHVQKKNEELNYLSEYDPLCNVYNRRGFIEQAMHLNQGNLGKKAFLAFADLDDLKKINDTFGHAAGDDALRAASFIFKNVTRGGDLVARIGGDEFVGMFIAGSMQFRKNFSERIKQAIDKHNENSDKPYFVDFSVGITDFTCEQGLEISGIINKADRYLYEAKKQKRSSVLK